MATYIDLPLIWEQPVGLHLLHCVHCDCCWTWLEENPAVELQAKKKNHQKKVKPIVAYSSYIDSNQFDLSIYAFLFSIPRYY